MDSAATYCRMTDKSSKTSGDWNWPKDEFGRREAALPLFWFSGFAILILLLVLLSLVRHSPSDKKGEVIVYCAQDQVYAEPIFKDFEKETGIKVEAVFDSEAVKTVGIANRLLAERRHPQCDVLWGNEELRVRQLAAQNVLRETNGWFAFGFRSRRIVINTNLVALSAAPHSLIELTNAAWRSKVALAYPQFGTTATHFHALRQLWGPGAWLAWCQALEANQPILVDGNSVVVNQVGKGRAAIGLSDSDDIAEGQENGYPIAELPINNEILLIPNTVAIVRGAPHPDAAQRLAEFLRQPAIAKRLVAAHALESASSRSAATTTLQPDWDTLLRDLDSTTETLNRTFLR
jgi:iron(III) transport system substrate-binding protein